MFEPGPELRDIVRYFWTFEGVATHEEPYVLRTVANGCPEFVFHYKGTFEELGRDGKSRTSFITGIHGQAGEHRRFIVKESFGICGAYLYPYALHAVFGIPGIEFTNQLSGLELLPGAESFQVMDSLHAALNNQERLRIMSDFLIRKKRPLVQKDIAGAVRTILMQKGLVSVKNLSELYFRSHRQFERNFKEHTGFTAKTFSRIVRFNSLMQRHLNTQSSLTEIALEFGYYDQSHFINDFRAFSGYSPRTYFSGKAAELL
ncbi:helix-turn-helix domain-containing protein [Chryseolinea sp. T2]